jgi:8-oxo-dGTP pyrophosphatase MutT (NUDIX family)
MLDFAKGKADEGESDVECAIREINEEVGFNIRPYINEDHFIKVETLKGKFVKLFMVRDIDENNPALVAATQRLITTVNPTQMKRF